MVVDADETMASQISAITEVVEEEEGENVHRDKVVGLDDYTLELHEQIASLKAENDLFEFEEIEMNKDMQQTMFE